MIRLFISRKYFKFSYLIKKKKQASKMSDLLFSEDQHLFDSGPIRVAGLHAEVNEMMERAAALGEKVVEDIQKIDDEDLIYIFTNEQLWLERLEHLNAARYRTGSDLSCMKDELSPDETFQVKASMSKAKLVAQKVNHMLRKVKSEMKARNL